MGTKLNYSFSFNIHENENTLSVKEYQLLQEAREALNKSYSPYSHFQVGCALLLDNGTIVKGANQENAAYPSGLCAERVAFFSKGVSFPENKIAMAVVVARKSGEQLLREVTPCGACRQVMLEYEIEQKQLIQFMMQGKEGKVIICNSIADLLPFSFSMDNLKF